MPREPKVVPMGLITAEPLHSTTRKLKFATNTAVLGKSRNSTAIHAPGMIVAPAGGPNAHKAAKKDVTGGAKKKTAPDAGARRGRGAAGGAHGEDGAASGMVFNKGHGQHILKNPLVIAAIVEKAAVKSTDVVLEIGPGTGNLTEKLLLAAKKVIAYEIDPRMVAELTKRFHTGSPLGAKLEIVRGNCLDHEFPYFDKCVANVPYAISSALVFKLLRHPFPFTCAILMFQREFALRVCAQPESESYCRLSVNSQLLARCSHLMKVSKNSFNPPPKVESSVIRLEPRVPRPEVDFAEWDGLVKMIFNRKNKKVSSIFKTKAAIEFLHERFLSYRRMEQAAAAPQPASANQTRAAATAAATAEMPLASFKELLAGALASEPLLARRGRSLNLEEIAQLLSHFVAHGIHFS